MAASENEKWMYVLGGIEYNETAQYTDVTIQILSTSPKILHTATWTNFEFVDRNEQNIYNRIGESYIGFWRSIHFYNYVFDLVEEIDSQACQIFWFSDTNADCVQCHSRCKADTSVHSCIALYTCNY